MVSTIWLVRVEFWVRFLPISSELQNCFVVALGTLKERIQGNGYLRGPNHGLSQKVVVSVVKKTDGRVKASRVERSQV